jgi:hypothetical protein
VRERFLLKIPHLVREKGRKNRSLTVAARRICVHVPYDGEKLIDD